MPHAKRTVEGANKVADLVHGGLSVTKASEQIAAEYGVVARTVRRWVRDIGLDLGKISEPSRFRDFNDARRAETGNELAEVLEGRIAQLAKMIQEGEPVDSRQIKDLTVAFGVLTDKRRLEEGLSTDRVETEVVPARLIIQGKIDELAERRSKRDG